MNDQYTGRIVIDLRADVVPMTAGKKIKFHNCFGFSVCMALYKVKLFNKKPTTYDSKVIFDLKYKALYFFM